MKTPHAQSARRYIAVGAIVTAGAVGAGATVSITLSSAGPQPHSASRRSLRSLTRHFTIFSRSTPPATYSSAHAAAAADRLPVEVQNGLSSRVEARYALNLSLAQNASAGGRGIWVVPGAYGACLAEQIDPTIDVYATVCAPTTAVEAGQLYQMPRIRPATTPAAAVPLTVVGLAPDGNQTVTFVNRDGTSQEVPVVGNVYVATSSSTGPATLKLLNASGSTVAIKLPVPGTSSDGPTAANS